MSLFHILFYSKYSKKCEEVHKLINELSITTINNLNLKLICIDNSDTRNMILKSSLVKIQSVPAILSVYQDGYVETFENQNVINWINSMKIKYQSTLVSNIEETKIEEDKEVDSKVKTKKNPKKKKEDDVEVIEDKSEESEDENENKDEEIEMVETKKNGGKPPMSIIKDSGNIEFVDVEEISEEQERPVNVKKGNKVKREDVMAEAEKIAKAREQEDKKIKRK